MSQLAAFSLAFVATPALAHPGHIAEQASHSHWIALAATFAAAAIVVVGIARAVSRQRSRKTAYD